VRSFNSGEIDAVKRQLRQVKDLASSACARRQQIAELRGQGYSHEGIGRRAGASRKAVSNVLRRMGMTRGAAVAPSPRRYSTPARQDTMTVRPRARYSMSETMGIGPALPGPGDGRSITYNESGYEIDTIRERAGKLEAVVPGLTIDIVFDGDEIRFYVEAPNGSKAANTSPGAIFAGALANHLEKELGDEVADHIELIDEIRACPMQLQGPPGQ
jgi:hypothetical protein